MKSIRIGLIGLGTVGGGVYEILKHKQGLLEKRAGVRVELAYACDRSRALQRKLGVPNALFVRDAAHVLGDPSVDIVIELIGGTKIARQVILEALRHGKHVVTANKALLAENSAEIFGAAARARRGLYFEASIGGGIPIVKSLREAFVSNHIQSIYSIINGTSNYILTRMAKDHLDFRTALREAQGRGYAEADPTLDISGGDAAHKIALLATLAFGGLVPFREVSVEGITGITQEDISFAQEFGYVIKLLAIAKKTQGGIEARVQPTLLPKSHILANVDDAFNAIQLHGDEIGEALLYGRGAGRRPTASAVISDVMELAALIRAGRAAPQFDLRRRLKVKRLSDIDSRYYLRLVVRDRPGVLGRVATQLARKGISISDVIQKERRAGRAVPLILLTHHTREDKIRSVVRGLNRLEAISGKTQVIRIEDEP